MCGIAGFISPQNMGEPARVIAKKLVRAITHRGPDSHGLWSDDRRLMLVHTRLAIVDLSAEGHQPMVSASGRYVISFNGEIYNHLELRKKLATAGVNFRGRSDTEVLLQHIEVYGLMATLECVTGMFAVALADLERQRLYLICDRLGEKPIYYGYANGELVFGSELKVLMAYPGFPFRVDDQALSMLLKYSYIPAPSCILQNAFKIQPGYVAEFDLDSGRLAVDPYAYWSLDRVVHQATNQDMSEDDAADLVEGKMTEIISRQIMADVPVGSFLSGGIDSTLVSALAHKQLATPLRTFTIGFEIPDYNEAPAAMAVAKHLGSQHQEWIVQPKDILDVIPDMADIYSEPFGDSSQLPTTLLSRLTRKSVTVCLSGDGGDELFGGYNRYLWTKKIWSLLRLLPSPLTRGLGNGISSLPPALLANLNVFQIPSFSHKVIKVGALLGARSQTELYDRLISCWFDPQKILARTESRSIVPTSLEGLNLVEFMMKNDSKYYLPGDIMVKVDRATMSVALESRAPFLDHELYQLAWSLPLQYKVRDGKGKYIIRKILKKYVPESLWQRPKSGFGVPLDHWFRGDLRVWLNDLLSESRLKRDGFFNSELIQKRIHEHQCGYRNWQHQLWTVAMFQIWYDRWSREENRAPL